MHIQAVSIGPAEAFSAKDSKALPAVTFQFLWMDRIVYRSVYPWISMFAVGQMFFADMNHASPVGEVRYGIDILFTGCSEELAMQLLTNIDV